MADDEAERIDPRYDPAFQRGYAGGVRTATRRDPAPTAPPTRRSVEPVPPAAEAPRVIAPVPPVEGESSAAAAASAPAEPTPATGAPAVAPASPWEATRNPFYLAAAALAALLIVAGAVWLQQGFAAIAAGGLTDVGYWAATTMSFGAPLLIGIGVAIVGALLFVLARAWRPRG